MNIIRKKTKTIIVGNVPIGGNNPIPIQTMTNTKTSNVIKTIQQIKLLENAGADIIRVSINDNKAADSIYEIIRNVNVPIVADIHFNYIFALKAIDAGVAKVRINPGNIGDENKIKQVLNAAKNKNIPIRIGINSGSLEKEMLDKYRSPNADALVESALKHIDIANKFRFDDIIIAVKSSSLNTTIDAYRLLSQKTNYPLHLGLTEAGSIFTGTIKSIAAMSILLAEGIGDTIRISLTAAPDKEVEAGIKLLSALGLRQPNIDLIACPTCARTETDIISIVEKLEQKLNKIKVSYPVKVAIMGCVVNGPGEAQDSNIAICCSKNYAKLYVNGQELDRINHAEILDRVLKEVQKYINL
ncbi:MAG: flavodoxin-dependent (E)-4-hydroxy-3-methylbut-2-enyl-diphosphate synthase [Bacteroidetes bacterium]|nr:flavodoxin-dependent (E)-4-hydroxy-3-methylbut-2-enyl-diphosphate synthase [Bacteroidota bacterium]